MKCNQILVYLDHNIICGMATNDTKYEDLNSFINKVIRFGTIVFPYSIVHIQELAEAGQQSGMPKEERFKLVEPKLQFIKKVSNSIKIFHNDDCSKFFYKCRDPFEAYNTFTEVELHSASTFSFMNLIPKAMIQNLQQSFSAGACKLNNMNEEEAIIAIDTGIQDFINKCNNDKEFHKKYIQESKSIAIKMVTDNHSQCLLVIDETISFMMAKNNSDVLDISSNALVDSKIEKLKNQKIEMLNSLSAQIKQVSDSCDKSLHSCDTKYSFETFLDQICEVNNAKCLPRSFYKTILLDLFGFKSKMKNRRSDFYDALHRQHAKACNIFVTDDLRFQEKLGQIGRIIPETNCILLDSSGFTTILNNALAKIEKAEHECPEKSL